MGEWTLFSNHGHVLVCLANNNEARLRDVAAEVGITERAVQNILRELQQAGIVQVSKHGRCNHYQINTRKPLRHPLEAHCSVGKLLSLLKTADNEVVKSKSPVTKRPAPKDGPAAKASVAKPAAAKTVINKPVGPPASKQTESEITTASNLAGEQVKDVRVEETHSEHAPVEATLEAGRKPAEDKSTAKEADKNAAEDKSTEKGAGKKASKADDVPPSTPQGSLF